MADPLKLLRDFALDGKAIKEKNEYIVFGDIAFKKSEKTNFRTFGRTNEYYTLESLHYFYQKKDLTHTAYVKEAASIGMLPVTRPDRKDLVDYLTNRNAKQPSSIDVTAPIPAPIHLAKGDHSEGPPEKRPRAEEEERERRERERIGRMLDAPLRNIPSQGDAALRDLSADLPKDKIAHLRSKVMSRKRTLITKTDEDPNAAADILAAPPIDSAEFDSTKVKERQWKTRTSCMQAATKNFAKTIFPTLQLLKTREEGIHNSSSTAAHNNNAPVRKDTDNKTKNAQQSGYNRYDQEKFREEETEGFQIDTMGTYHGITLKSITEGAKPKQQAAAPSSNSSQNGTERSSSGGQKKRTSRTPIIIIPSSTTNLVTMYNVKDLLQDLKFVSTEDKRKNGCRRDNEVLIQRRKQDGSCVPFRVIDNVSKLTDDDWDRVVACFVQGPVWQFKDWPGNYSANPVNIFMKICAFHLKWDEMKTDANVAKWNVHLLSLAKNKRHLDRANMLKFWDTLEKHMIKNKPHLRF